MYTANDFYDIDSVHPYMMLWLFNRLQEIRNQMNEEYKKTLGDEDEVDFRHLLKIRKMSWERIQQETGLADDDLEMLYRLGTVIHEYEYMRKMSDHEREEYIEFAYNIQEYDENLLSEEEKNNLEEVRDAVVSILEKVTKDYESQQNAFNEIIDNNFNIGKDN